MSTKTINLTYFIFKLVIVFILCAQLSNCGIESLFDDTDDVIVLNNATFPTKLADSDSVWIVEFYNSWCGHCITYAPKWKEFAKEMAEWWPLLQVAAINCAEEKNRDVCRDHNVTGVPCLKLFPPRSKINDSSTETFYPPERGVLEAKILDFMANRDIFEPPPHWPRLSPIMSMQDIWEETKDEHHHVAFVFEEPESFVGRQVILDMYRYKPLLVRRMLKQNVKKFGIVDFPSLYLINRNGTFTRLAKKDNSRAGMVKALTGLLTPLQQEAGNQYMKKRLQKHQPEEHVQKQGEPIPVKQEIKPGVYMADLESTLHYIFRQEIAICQHIDGDKLLALKLFIKALVKYLPSREVVQSYLEKISSWLLNDVTELTGDVWLTTIDKLQTGDSYLPEHIEWMGCAGSEPHYRGYPCGMWTLFHSLTVGAYKHNRENPKDLPIEMLSTIQGYMKHFFGCHTCVQHFLKMAAKIKADDKSPHAATLWLWQAHNQVNKRLHGDRSEDPLHPKIQFPSKHLCPECFKGDKFDKGKVFKFLLRFYGKSHVIPLANEMAAENYGIDTVTSAVNGEKQLDWWEMQQRKKDLEKIRSLRQIKLDKVKQSKDDRKKALKEKTKGKNTKHDAIIGFDKSSIEFEVKVKPGWGISNLDMSLCATFYTLCVFIIILLYYHFIVRKKYRPCGSPSYNKVRN